MRKYLWNVIVILACAAAGESMSRSALAVDGTWNVAPLGEWDAPASWVGGTIADGAGATANFTQPDLNGVNTVVNLSTARTIGNLVFADSNVGTGGGLNWDIQGAVPLTLSGATPTITVNAMNPGGAAVISAPLAGTQGFTKAGVGQLTLGATLPHTLTGGINVNGGTLRLDDAAVVPAQAIVIRNGATLSVQAGIGTAAGPLNIPAGATANLVSRSGAANGGNTSAALGGGAGSTLNVTTELDGGTISADGNWATGGSLGALNITGVPGGALEYFRIRSNGGAYVANSLLNTALNLNEVVMHTRTNSGGNTVDIGSLTGSANAILSGGGGGGFGPAGTGSFATYSIGAFNTSTTFAGTIDVVSAMPDNANVALMGGINLTKVGTGTLTLSGTLLYQPTTNSMAARRGGITTVSNGTLKLTGGAAIPGGVTDGVTNFLSTVRLLSDAVQGTFGTLDVSGVTTPYSTAALQQIIGSGRIAGNYTHDEGTLAPGDTLNGTTPTPLAAAGTLTFNNNLSFAGSGAVKFDISPSLTTGNDKIVVGGVTNLTGTPTLNFGFLGGVTTGAYSLLESTGGFTGNTSGWTVNFGGGRGTPPAVTVAGNQLRLTVSESNFGNLNWTGATDGVWVAGPVLNWRNNGTGAADRFFDLDIVTFADTFGPGTPVTNSAVTLDSTVSPLTVTVNSSAVSYSITGTGRISGGASFNKTGTSTLILQTANDFNGPASISGTGGVDIGAFPTALGSGQLTMTNTKLLAAPAATGAMANTLLVLPTGTTSTVEVNGAAGAFVIPSLSGDGNLNIASQVQDRLIDLGTNNSQYTGDVNVAPDMVNSTKVIIRLSGAGSSLTNSTLTLTSSELRDRSTSVQTITLGALVGNAASILKGYEGGSTPTDKTWQIGTLNTSTTFDGTLINGIGVSVTNISKVGTGTLTFTGANTYTGFTGVIAGTLSIANPYLADTADVFLTTGAVLNLNTAGATDAIDALFVDGIARAPGVYGAVGSGAQFTTPLITGSGFLQVQATGLPGDFDNNNVVDALDLAVWRAAYGPNARGDANGDGDTDGGDFLIWQRSLGRTNPAAPATGTVPEPGMLTLLGAALASIAAVGRRHGRR